MLDRQAPLKRVLLEFFERMSLNNCIGSPVGDMANPL